jgi:hypothetical protein
MKTKGLAAAVIVGAVVLLAMGLRSGNRADAADTSCFAEGPGPSEPTVCN